MNRPLGGGLVRGLKPGLLGEGRRRGQQEMGPAGKLEHVVDILGQRGHGVTTDHCVHGQVASGMCVLHTQHLMQKHSGRRVVHPDQQHLPRCLGPPTVLMPATCSCPAPMHDSTPCCSKSMIAGPIAVHNHVVSAYSPSAVPVCRVRGSCTGSSCCLRLFPGLLQLLNPAAKVSGPNNTCAMPLPKHCEDLHI